MNTSPTLHNCPPPASAGPAITITLRGMLRGSEPQWVERQGYTAAYLWTHPQLGRVITLLASDKTDKEAE